ncbi:hypothetical protein EJ06DRAFT_557289 [Trichodelitschia bisporula]|uniref:Uncharacterized protein n=1 Tax=Trichodelitschia bisporula TaxID=703511 RepID=A0A6G1HU67_9PEZI|nr:hypothetical protein EJ06DRAFT_557289 [Trichodelitschia bisporula]
MRSNLLAAVTGLFALVSAVALPQRRQTINPANFRQILCPSANGSIIEVRPRFRIIRPCPWSDSLRKHAVEVDCGGTPVPTHGTDGTIFTPVVPDYACVGFNGTVVVWCGGKWTEAWLVHSGVKPKNGECGAEVLAVSTIIANSSAHSVPANVSYSWNRRAHKINHSTIDPHSKSAPGPKTENPDSPPPPNRRADNLPFSGSATNNYADPPPMPTQCFMGDKQNNDPSLSSCPVVFDEWGFPLGTFEDEPSPELLADSLAAGDITQQEIDNSRAWGLIPPATKIYERTIVDDDCATTCGTRYTECLEDPKSKHVQLCAQRVCLPNSKYDSCYPLRQKLPMKRKNGHRNEDAARAKVE